MHCDQSADGTGVSLVYSTCTSQRLCHPLCSPSSSPWTWMLGQLRYALSRHPSPVLATDSVTRIWYRIEEKRSVEGKGVEGPGIDEWGLEAHCEAPL